MQSAVFIPDFQKERTKTMADENKKPETEENSPVADEKDTAPKEEKPFENTKPLTENSGDGNEQDSD